MKKIIALVLTVFIISCQSNKEKDEPVEEHNHSDVKTEVGASKSPQTSTMETIGGAHIHIDYSSPRVRNRIIFGGLLAYDEVWQAGAHMATWVETSKDLTISGQVLSKGKYGFFIIPSQGEWTVIFNKNWNQHGKDDYNESEDVVRFKVAPEFSDEIKEELEYKIQKTDNSKGIFSLEWEKVKISFPFVVNETNN
ncbi:DUF2911 domain-containing protein [Planktosalinus lacus]|uniref:DUF2911 domain-containing protein n=1 Tax=Planktosalinus lacus TaxID=1526573 RepID=A0A8J2Y8G5_9FLAO|nr:DUF2911 domain-containing protein [Planktosalinus lacus]GGD86087.1 hypothetical protein GCM10011312_07660 [Planktosalinus lacus]